MVSVKENLQKIETDFHSLAIDSNCLHSITWLNLFKSSNEIAFHWSETHLHQIMNEIVNLFSECELWNTETNNYETWATQMLLHWSAMPN